MFIALQPIVNAEIKSTFGFEVLARNSADSTSFIPPPPHHIFWSNIDKQAIVQSDRHLQCSRHVFVNVSETTLADDFLFTAWSRAIKQRARKGQMVIEITELVSDHTLSQRWGHIKELGVQLSLDDYGKHFNGLSRLERYQWDYCKLEMHQQLGLTNECVIALEQCRARSIEVIAERVETSQHANQAMSCGIHLQQGYFWGRPELAHAPLAMVAE